MNEESGFSKGAAIVLGGGGVEYSAAEAATPIDELIQALEEARDDGAEWVVMSSGNYRGAQWASVRADWSWMDEG